MAEKIDYTVSGFYNTDCLEAMKCIPDKYFDLAIVDPPYGIGFDGDSTLGNNSSAKWKKPNKTDKYKIKEWDIKPNEEYFIELFRVSKHQIIWGGNYFSENLYSSGGWIVWSKGVAKGMSLSDAEMAWTNCKNNIKIIELLWSGFRKCETTDRFHPTQKPVALYEWLLKNYAKQGDKILDTHVGSASSLIACYNLGFEYVGFELDEEYYLKAKKRLEQRMNQMDIFNMEGLEL